MKIAQIAPLIEKVPRGFMAGSNELSLYLTDELVRLGTR